MVSYLYKYIAPGSSLYPCPLFSPPHRPLARIIMCDEPAFHSAHFSQGVRDTQITGASHRYRIVSGSSGEGGGWGGDTPSTAIGDAILGTKDLSRLWGLLGVQLNSITPPVLPWSWVYSELGNIGLGSARVP